MVGASKTAHMQVRQHRPVHVRKQDILSLLPTNRLVHTTDAQSTTAVVTKTVRLLAMVYHCVLAQSADTI